ncbi:RNA polymerase sigma factor [Thalassospira mesophila]|uniref:RNA polymerase sigma factor n=1 Tax=Thalassospira mesophila TaxID=1293891 RepID=UPI0011811B98|nr:RNA polymerase sigma factor [Thalassospira mesophila]
MGDINRNNFLVTLTENETAFAHALQDALAKALADQDAKVTSIWAHLEAARRARLAQEFVAGVSFHATNHFGATSSEASSPVPDSIPLSSFLPGASSALPNGPASQPVSPDSPTDTFAPPRDIASTPAQDGTRYTGKTGKPNNVTEATGDRSSAPRHSHSAYSARQQPAHPASLPSHRAPAPEVGFGPNAAKAQSANAAFTASPDPDYAPFDARNTLAPNFWPLWIDQQDCLMRQCLKLMSGNMDDAQDALSEAMVKASVKFEESMHDIRNHRAWLSRIVHNACIDLHRQNRRKAEYHEEAHSTADDAMPAITYRDVATPEQNALTGEMFAKLDTALANLPEKLRRPLLMRCVYDQSYDEIAKHLGLSNCAVRKRVQLARDQLRGCEIR